MKKIRLIVTLSILLLLMLMAGSCKEMMNQEATLEVTNESGHIQYCILNGGNIATLEPGETKQRTIQTGSYVIEFRRANNTVCCSAAYFEAKAGHLYRYSCSN